jgi:uncharacterized protein (DUF2062 family)
VADFERIEDNAGATRKSRLVRWSNYIWPRMGLKRYALYLRHRVGRMPGTAHSIAAGLASGAAMSMTPFLGLHFLLGAFLAWILRGNILASAIGTVLGNPWTFPLIWIWTYRVGCWIMAKDPVQEKVHNLSVASAVQAPLETLEPFILPMLVGSIPLGLMLWFGIYWPLRGAITRYKAQQTERRHKKAIELIRRMEQQEKAADDSRSA